MVKIDEFLNELETYKKDNIPPDAIKALQPYIKDPDFDPEKVRTKSAAAAGLCEWVININKYHEAFQIVNPKQKAALESQYELEAAQDELRENRAKLDMYEEELRQYQQEMDTAIREKQKCQDEADNTATKIDLAQRLVSGLKSEKERWRKNGTLLEGSKVTIPGNILLVSCFISYAGCFSKFYRIELMQNKWIPALNKIKPQINYTENRDFLETICDKVQFAEWNNQGLPSDRISIENGTLCN